MSIFKIKTQDEIAAIAGEKRSAGGIIGFTNGCFDILHPGHVRYLCKARAGCDCLIVGMNSDRSVKRLKGPNRPVNTENDRMEVLAAVEYVDLITLFDEDTPENLIKSITPHVLFKGGDWNEDNIAGAGHVRSHGGKVSIIPFVKGRSTTDLIRKIRASVS